MTRERASRDVPQGHGRMGAIVFNGAMDANTNLRQSLNSFYEELGATVRRAADLVRVPNGHNAEVLRSALLRTIGSVDVLGNALKGGSSGSKR